MNNSSQDSTNSTPVSAFDSRDCVDLFFDGPGDNTVGPLPDHLLPLAMAERERIARWQKLLDENGKDQQGKDSGSTAK